MRSNSTTQFAAKRSAVRHVCTRRADKKHDDAPWDMASEGKKEIQLEIAHVLFIDIVGYSKLLSNEQRALRDTLNQVVRNTSEFRSAEEAARLLKLPTGDGMALVFYKSPEEPVECALEITRALRQHPKLKLRMGAHSGPISGMVDVDGKANVAGAGVNTAQRVMDCGDSGHTLLSKRVARSGRIRTVAAMLARPWHV